MLNKNVEPARPRAGIVEENYDFDDEVIAKRLEDVHIRRSLATTYSFDHSFKTKIDAEVEQHMNQERARHPSSWSEEPYNADLTKHEIEASILGVKENGSLGPDGLHPKMLKFGGKLVVDATVMLLQFSWYIAQFASSFKRQNMIYLQKPDKPDYNHEKSYRPISLTSILGKIFEEIIARRLVAFLHEVGFFENQPQFAYLKGLDATQALLLLTLHVQDSFKNGKYTAAAFLDMEGAFDSVWRKGLIHKLIKLGLKGRLLLIIDDFLKNRLTRSMVNNIITNYISTEVGVPQGSVLSVILFLVFFGDMSDDLSTHFKFADDLTVWQTDESPDKAADMLTTALTEVYTWSQKWQMGISAPKSKIMCFSHKSHHNIEVKYNHQPLEQVIEIRSLGVILDERLTFKPHVDKATKTAGQIISKLGVFSKEIGGAPAQINLMLYKSCILLQLEYGYPVWCGSKHADNIHSIQYTALRKALGVLDKSSGAKIELLAHILPIDIRLDTTLIMAFIRIFRQPPSNRLRQLVSKLMTCPRHQDHRIITPIHKFKMASRYLMDFNLTDIEEIYHETVSDITRKRPTLADFDTDLGSAGSRSAE